MAETQPTVLSTDHGRVRVLTMNRPQAKNAFNQELYLALTQALNDADADHAVRVVVITGADGAFTAGQDLSEMAGMKDAEGVIGFESLLDAFDDFSKPLMAAVNGIGLGLGLTVLLHTDINFIADDARLKCPFVTLGVVPEAASSYLLPAVIGYQRAAEFLFQARWMSAQEAVELGIVLAAVPGAELMTHTLKMAEGIAQQPPAAVRETKRLLKCWRQASVADARSREGDEFGNRLVSPEFKEAVSAFFEKRAPNFDDLPEG